MNRGIESLKEMQLSEEDARIIAFSRMPPQAPPVIRDGSRPSGPTKPIC